MCNVIQVQILFSKLEINIVYFMSLFYLVSELYAAHDT